MQQSQIDSLVFGLERLAKSSEDVEFVSNIMCQLNTRIKRHLKHTDLYFRKPEFVMAYADWWRKEKQLEEVY